MGNRGAGRTPLNWESRTHIALDAARGIEYLHSRGPTVIHGNIKSSNVLLTKSYSACVSDFGLAHLVGPTATPNRVGGYRAPEVIDARMVSQKADVYSFGVLLLELLTGKAPTHAVLNEEGVDLPRWVQSVVREEWTAEVFDLELLRYQNVEEDMVQLLQLAVDCAAQYPDNRPSMSEALHRIEELCRASQFQEQEGNQRSIGHAEDGSSQRTNLADGSGPPPPPSSSLFD
ncbi:putative inactive receptor kinase [Asimina triloba]